MECSVGLLALARLLACSWPLPPSLAFFLPPFLLFLLLLLPHLLLLLVMPLYSTPRMSECRRRERKRESEETNGREDSKQKQNNCVAKQTKTKRASEFAQCKTTQWSNAKGPPKRTKGKRNTEVWKRGWEGREDGQPD